MIDLDILIPVYNEAGNIEELITRLDKSFGQAHIKYRLIFIDDNSTDSTPLEIRSFAKKFPVILHTKEGEKGKAFSIIEGYKLSQSPYIAMIDGDLQYPPEKLPEMYELAKNYGVAVANRKNSHSSLIRKIGSRLNSFVFGKTLLGLNCDVQSGLKVFKREIIENLD